VKGGEKIAEKGESSPNKLSDACNEKANRGERRKGRKKCSGIRNKGKKG